MKYIAIGLGLFLVGCACILFAFEVNGYYQNKLNTKKELRVVREIVTELDYYNFMRKHGGGRMKEVIGAAENLLNAIRDPEVQLSKEDIDLNLHKLNWVWLSATPITSYVALNSSGDFSFLSSMSLRKKFANFNADQEKLLQFEAIQTRFVDQQLRPFLNHNTDRTTIDSYQFGATLKTKRYSSPFTNTNYKLLKNREFANLLTDLLFFTKRLFLPYDRLGNTTLDIKEIIKKEYTSIEID